jgi:hypothetical protein
MTASTSRIASSKTPSCAKSSTSTKSSCDEYCGREAFISLPFSSDRVAPLTRIPRFSRLSTTWAPMNPVAPVTRTYLSMSVVVLTQSISTHCALLWDIMERLLLSVTSSRCRRFQNRTSIYIWNHPILPAPPEKGDHPHSPGGDRRGASPEIQAAWQGNTKALCSALPRKVHAGPPEPHVRCDQPTRADELLTQTSFTSLQLLPPKVSPKGDHEPNLLPRFLNIKLGGMS